MYRNPPLFMGDVFQDAQYMSETAIVPIYTVFFP